MAFYFSSNITRYEKKRKGFFSSHIRVFELWVWHRLVNVCWKDRVSNEEVLKRFKEERNIFPVHYCIEEKKLPSALYRKKWLSVDVVVGLIN